MEHNTGDKVSLYHANNVGEHIYRDYQDAQGQRRTYYLASTLKAYNRYRIMYMFLQRSPYQKPLLAIFQLIDSKVTLEVHHLFFYVNTYP